ncbi:hypothetical protein D9613_012418 [Agrocybe pediades]|uniref:Uncharacterized protein n=1 Tax=Agrocybe pediades TaxID=84607 RepID=A0A8H4QRU7_9AGAR|nr:hypothetical protein D9613_012418 [Agrocybe pediades]
MNHPRSPSCGLCFTAPRCTAKFWATFRAKFQPVLVPAHEHPITIAQGGRYQEHSEELHDRPTPDLPLHQSLAVVILCIKQGKLEWHRKKADDIVRSTGDVRQECRDTRFPPTPTPAMETAYSGLPFPPYYASSSSSLSHSPTPYTSSTSASRHPDSLIFAQRVTLSTERSTPSYSMYSDPNPPFAYP